MEPSAATAPADALPTPDGKAQERVIRDAWENAGIPLERAQYVEIHGSGTRVGDPIEASALGAVFSSSRTSDKPLLLGSVKTNVGHLEGAAGIAGLVKTILCLKERELVPTLNYRPPIRRYRSRICDSPPPPKPGRGRIPTGFGAQGRVRRPRSRATTTAWVRSLTSSLAKTRRRWVLTVASAMTSAVRSPRWRGRRPPRPARPARARSGRPGRGGASGRPGVRRRGARGRSRRGPRRARPPRAGRRWCPSAGSRRRRPRPPARSRHPVVRGEDEHPRPCGSRGDRSGGLDAVHDRHPQVDERDVGHQSLDEVEGLASVARLPDDLQGGFRGPGGR
ncbi:hypothetical protein STANM309S_04553 [Streptomyces tanashiensis]